MANFVPAGYEDEYSDDSDDFAFNYYHNVSHSFNLLLDVFLYMQGLVGENCWVEGFFVYVGTFALKTHDY